MHVAAVHVTLHAACVHVCVRWTEARERPGSLVRPDSGLAPGSRCFWSCSISLYRHVAEPCQSKRCSNDTDEGWRSRRWQMWKRSAVEGAGTDLSGFDGSLKHCSERGAVISLTIPPCNEARSRGRPVTKHRGRRGEVCKEPVNRTPPVQHELRQQGRRDKEATCAPSLYNRGYYLSPDEMDHSPPSRSRCSAFVCWSYYLPGLT